MDLWKPDECAAQRKMKKLSKDKVRWPGEVVLRFPPSLIPPATSGKAREFGFPPLLLHEERAGVRMTEESRREKRVMGAEGPDRWVGINPDPSYLPSIFHSAGRWISCSGVGGGGSVGSAGTKT